MQFKAFLAFGLASLTLAVELDGPAVKNALKAIDSGAAALDQAIQGITTANVATQVDVVVAKMSALNQAMIDTSARLKSTKPLGIMDITSLSTPMTAISKTLESLMKDILAKRTIIVKGGQADKLGLGLKKNQNGFGVFSEALMTQVPSNFAAQMPKGGNTNLPAGLNINANKASDLMFDIAMAIFKGSDTTVKVSGAIWPLAAKRSVEFNA
jgi:hypothetical protein